MKRQKDEIEEVEEVEERSAEELKKERRKEGMEKRKNAKKRDKVARWGGLILFGLIVFVGFLMWVFGEMSLENTSTYQSNDAPIEIHEGSVIVQ
jgi:uncharacterized membrane protein